MTSIHDRFRTARGLAGVALFVAVVGAFGAGVYSAVQAGAGNHFAAAVSGIGGAVLFIVGVCAYCHTSILLGAFSNTYRSYDVQRDTQEMIRRHSDYLRTIAESISLSDWAKRVVHREKDFEFLRDTIHSAAIRQDWEAAEHLIKDMEEQLGYHEEAARLRDEVTQARHATTEDRVTAALSRFEKLCVAHKWDQARREADRLRALFPGDPRIASLGFDIESRRQQVKRDLLGQYEDAIQVNDVDKAHDLLFELDHYLTPQEAAQLKDSARAVFKGKLEQMRVEFSLAVSDKRFETAIDVGEDLIREFPNTRYAREIRDMMPLLRQRAANHTTRNGAPVGAG
ncbi:MAG: hypothetical protein JNG88_00195 [Phycisphaerales bacterium]|nr:hypothetical protein [Phycisphaerales bacterium]